jgi:1-aminocyclopropane-1-carboxylate deaminase/D-cysteine desulfhydrase-like pyridoxal-dependent ACC family enzyme
LSGFSFAQDLVSVNDKYVGLGYSISQREERELINKVAHHAGVVADPTYTGTAKMDQLTELARFA